jgi:hypothetical protein
MDGFGHLCLRPARLRQVAGIVKDDNFPQRLVVSIMRVRCGDCAIPQGRYLEFAVLFRRILFRISCLAKVITQPAVNICGPIWVEFSREGIIRKPGVAGSTQVLVPEIGEKSERPFSL